VSWLRTLGRLLIGAGGLAAWLALAGTFAPQLDTVASLLPIFGVVIVLGLLLAWRPTSLTVAGALLGLAPVALAIVPEFTREIPPARAGTMQVRVLTHNVWRGNANPADTAQAIIDARPDVVLLQEVRGSFQPMLAALRQHFAYGTGCPSGCDLAILSRWPIVASDYFLKAADGHAFGPPMLWARITGPDQLSFTVLTLHYPRPGSDQAVHRRDVAQALMRIDRDPLIVAGDMNLTPWAAAMREQDRAFAPLTRMTRARATWPAAFPFLPIDQLYAGRDWGLVTARRLPATGSDHRPLLVTLGRR